MGPRGILVAAGTTLLALAGCGNRVTEVVVVIDTDLLLPGEATNFQLDVLGAHFNGSFVYGAGSAGVPNGPAPSAGLPLPTFPATIGLVPGGSGDAPFTVTASLATWSFTTFTRQIVVQRKVSGVQFVQGETRVLFISLLRACACQGTSCPDPRGTVECADVAAPTLPAFDPGRIPHLPPADGGPTLDAAVGDAADGPGPGFDLGTDRPAEVGMDAPLEAAADRPAEVTADRPPDVAPSDGGTGDKADGAADASSDAGDAGDAGDARDARDGGVETPPVLFARGHACTASGQCQDGFCVDSVCCGSACVCGTCGGGTPGACVSAAAGSDPRNACDAFTCNGAGACETSCAEGFGACSNACKIGSHCDGQGKCVVSTTEAGFFCIVGSCMCKAGLTCPAPDAGGAGKCQ